MKVSLKSHSFHSRIISRWDADSAPPQRHRHDAADVVAALLPNGFVVHQGLLGDFAVEDAQGVCHWCADARALALLVSKLVSLDTHAGFQFGFH